MSSTSRVSLTRAVWRTKLTQLVARPFRPFVEPTIFLLLAMAIWGYFPFERGVGVTGDGINFLWVAWRNAAGPLWKQLISKYPVDGWTRTLAFWPFVVAHHVSFPTVFLQTFYAAAWLLSGVAVARLTRVLIRGSELAPFISGCLMLTATSDSQTNLVVYAPHLFGIALFFFGTADLLVATRAESPSWTACRAFLLLLASFFTVEYTYPVVPTLLLFIYATRDRSSPRRAWRSVFALALAFIPALLVLAAELRRQGSWAANSTRGAYDLDWLRWVGRHFLFNFTPWQWAFRRTPQWFDNYGPSIPSWFFVSASALTAVIVILWVRVLEWARTPGTAQSEGKPEPGHKRSAFLLTLLAFLAALAANAGTARLGGEFCVRSHFVSRGWVSLGLGLILATLITRPSTRTTAYSVLSAFVFLGVWGGIERESYLRSYALYERRELKSLVEAVPRVPRDAHLVLIQPPGSPTLLACSNPNTLPYFYGDEGLRGRVVLVPNSWAAYSTVWGTDDGFVRIMVNSTAETVVPHGQTVLAYYSVSQHRFIRLFEFPAGLLSNSHSTFADYRLDPVPEGLPLAAPPSFAREFLAGQSLERDLPGAIRHGLPDMVTLAPELRSAVTTDSLAPFKLMTTTDGVVCWLGPGRGTGYSILLWSREARRLQFDLRTIIDPTRSEAGQTLVLSSRKVGEGGEGERRRLDLHEPLSDALNVAQGMNVLEMWIDGPENVPETTVNRPLAVLLQAVFISPAPADGNPLRQ
jgi:hypothetical protein